MSDVQVLGEILPHLEAYIKRIATETVKEEMKNIPNLPRTVKGVKAIAEIIRRHGKGSPIKSATLNTYAGQGKIPVYSRAGGRLVFHVADVLEWDRMGRPTEEEFYKDRI